jgi:hypothetical protein
VGAGGEGFGVFFPMLFTYLCGRVPGRAIDRTFSALSIEGSGARVPGAVWVLSGNGPRGLSMKRVFIQAFSCQMNRM